MAPSLEIADLMAEHGISAEEAALVVVVSEDPRDAVKLKDRKAQTTPSPKAKVTTPASGEKGVVKRANGKQDQVVEPPSKRPKGNGKPEGEEQEEKPKPRAKAKAKAKGKPVEEEEKPKPRAKAKAKAKGRPVEEEEEKPKPKAKAKAKGKPVEEEEEKPKPKAKAKAKGKPVEEEEKPKPNAKAKAKGKPLEEKPEEKPQAKAKAASKKSKAAENVEGEPGSKRSKASSEGKEAKRKAEIEAAKEWEQDMLVEDLVEEGSEEEAIEEDVEVDVQSGYAVKFMGKPGETPDVDSYTPSGGDGNGAEAAELVAGETKAEPLPDRQYDGPSPIEADGDTQNSHGSLATLLQGNEQMLAQTVADCTQRLLESPASELESSLHGC